MRILLLNPPNHNNNIYLPTAILSLKTYIEKKSDVKVDILDINIYSKRNDLGIPIASDINNLITYLKYFSKNNILNKFFDKYFCKIQFKEYSLLGISVEEIAISFCLAKYLKFMNPNIPIVLGGRIIFPKEFLRKYQFIDFIINGRGEESLLLLVNSLKQKINLSEIPNLIYRVNKKIIENPKKEFLIQNMPLTDYKVIDLEDYFRFSIRSLGLSKPIMPYFFIDGCVNRCSFCRLPNMQKLNIKYFNIIVKDIKELKIKYKTNYIMFLNNLLNISKPFVTKFTNLLIKSNLNILWSDSFVPKMYAKILLPTLYESGCICLTWGIESGSQDILDKMNKPINIKHCSELLRESHNAGIWNAVNIILGFPSERKKDVLLTNKFIKNNSEYIDELNLIEFILLEGSDCFNNPKRFNIEIRDQYAMEDIKNYQTTYLYHHYKFEEKNAYKRESKQKQIYLTRSYYESTYFRCRKYVANISHKLLYEMHSKLKSKNLVLFYLDYLYDTVKVLNIGYSCNNNCLFCGVSHKRNNTTPSLNNLKKELESFNAPFKKVVIIGGEPTIRKDIFEVIKYAKKLGYRKISLQTNGRVLYYNKYCKRITAAGIDEFVVSFHSHLKDQFDYFSRIKNSYDQTIDGLKNLKPSGAFIKINIVINKLNYIYLEDLVEFLLKMRINEVRFSLISIVGNAIKNRSLFKIRISKIIKHLVKAVEILNFHNVAFEFEGIPKCIFNNQNSKFIFESYKENVFADCKMKSKQCRLCDFYSLCTGPWIDYIKNFGWGEFQPIKISP